MIKYDELNRLNLGKKQIQNCVILADYLWSLPEDYTHFNMGLFFSLDIEENNPSEVEDHDPKNHCGAVACAVGHGPAAGIAPDIYDTTWWHYTNKLIGPDPSSFLFKWMFDAAWAVYDNTPHGAAQRIWYFLRNGLPELPIWEFVGWYGYKDELPLTETERLFLAEYDE